MEKSNVEKTAAAKVLYTGKTHTEGGREGISKSSDGNLDLILSTPGSNGKGTNPEQLFAAGWSACYIGALGLAAKKHGIVLAENTFVDAEVDLCNPNGAYFLQARLNVFLPGVDSILANELIELAHQTCPYSKATRGNIHVTITLIDND